ncbi:MAG: HEAT repeat domain-containing protein [Chitinophagaceae bacterium]|nr:HEAT repeat domain-containing protein [Chitinophagaceae bacterium]
MKVFVLSILFLSVVFSGVYLYSPDTHKTDVSLPDEKRTPEEELAGFKVPDGFVIELVASERDGIINPIDLSFDDAGRLWTQTASMYPLDPVADIQWNDLLELMDHPEKQKDHPAFKKMLDLYEGRTKGDDKILILSDLYTPGKTATTSVWADGLTIPMSILPYKDGAYVAQGSELFFLKDSNGDGKADQRIRLFTGFGFTDTHTMAHVLVRGPGGWIHFSHGALNKGNVSSLLSDAKIKIDYSKIARFSLDGKKIELVNAGLNNIWGFQLRHNGQWYGTEANDLGYSIVPMEPGTAFPGIGNERIRSYQPVMPELHKFRVGGTGISGLAFADDISGSFPDEWKDVAFLANPITSTINAVKIIRNADGTVSATHLPDLLSSEDKYFRPVNIEFGPDGCLYIADWYDKIISHNEIPTTHPDRDKSLGRIWRIRHKSQQSFAIPDFTKIKTEELVGHLKSPSLWMKRAAWHQLTDRPSNETASLIPALVTLAADGLHHELTRIHALWSLEGMGHYDAALMTQLLGAKADDLRREAARSLASFALTPTQVAGVLLPLLEDANPMVRSEVLRTLAAINKADNNTISMLVKAGKPALPGNEMGGSYERNFERYLALKALEQYPGELYTYLQSAEAAAQPALNVLWAIQALPEEQKEEKFIQLWPKAGITTLDEPTFIWLGKMLSNPAIYNMVKPVYENSANAEKYIALALHHQQQVQSEALSQLLENPALTLLKTGKPADKQLALDAIAKLRIKVPREPVVAMINSKADEKTIGLALRALEVNPSANKATFMQIARNPAHPFNLRLASLHSLAKTDTVLAKQTLANWISGLNDEQKKELTGVLSGSSQGAALLIDLYNKKRLNAKSFTLSSAERVRNTAAGNITGDAILEQTKKIAEEEKKAFETRLAKYMAIAEKKGGNAQKGKILFQSCLMCHKVGDKGPGIAPALDGSAAREDKALLTAILDPDAAVESGYMLYRVTKTDNSVLEGYLFEKNDRGTTLAFMGGSKIFVENKAIRNEGFLTGRSFMPKGLINTYTDAEVADLLAYIRTLK